MVTNTHRAMVVLAGLALPGLAHASIFTMHSECAAPLSVNLEQASPTDIVGPGGYRVYEMPPVAWQGIVLQQAILQGGGTGVAFVQDHTDPSSGVSFTIGTDVLAAGGSLAQLTLADIAPLVFPGGITGQGVVQTGGAGCLVDEIVVTDPLDTAIVQMQQAANASYPGTAPVQDGAASTRLRTSTFQTQLASARSLLLDAGCYVDSRDHIAGAFRPGDGATLGEDVSGAPLVGTLDLANRAFTGTLGGDPLGQRFARYDGTHRFVVTADAGFYVGYGARVEGRQGVFTGVYAECPVPVSAEAALAGWIDGSLDGLDAADAGLLAGRWAVELTCGTDVVPQTWTITDAGATYAIEGASLDAGGVSVGVDTAWFTTTDTYQLQGPPVPLALPPGIDPRPSGSVALQGPDAFSGTVDFVVLPCSAAAVRL